MIKIKEEKLANIQLTKDNFYIVTDFDGTLTNPDFSNSWEILTGSSYVSKQLAIEDNKLYQKYKPIEINTSLNLELRKEQMILWYQELKKLFSTYEIDANLVKKCVQEDTMKLREGVTKFFAFTNQYQIPVIIISAGIKDVIEEFLRFHHIYYDNIFIFSNPISLSTPIIHALNKNSVAFSDKVKQIMQGKEYALLLGDIVEDIQMLPKEKLFSTVTIGFLNEENNKTKERFKANFDIILTRDSGFQEIQELIQ